MEDIDLKFNSMCSLYKEIRTIKGTSQNAFFFSELCPFFDLRFFCHFVIAVIIEDIDLKFRIYSITCIQGPLKGSYLVKS